MLNEKNRIVLHEKTLQLKLKCNEHIYVKRSFKLKCHVKFLQRERLSAEKGLNEKMYKEFLSLKMLLLK